MNLTVLQMPAAVKRSIRKGATVPSRRMGIHPSPTHYPYGGHNEFQPSSDSAIHRGNAFTRQRVGNH